MRMIFSLATVFMLSFVFSTSCQDGDELTEGLIARDTLVEVLATIQVFESANQIAKDHINFKFDLYRSYKWIFDKYGIAELDFRNSVNYYSNDPKALELLYDEVIIRISEMQAESSS